MLESLRHLLKYAWGKPELTVLNPFAGGGSIPFERSRYGFEIHAVELNPVACSIPRGTLDHSFAFGKSLEDDVRKYGNCLVDQLQKQLRPLFSSVDAEAYIWARTVACPYTAKPVPLAPNWWLVRSGASGKAVLPSFEEDYSRARFRLVEIEEGFGPDAFDLVHGTVRRGRSRSPWANDQAIEGDCIKAEAQAGRMASQMYCVAVKKSRGGFGYRPPNDDDMEAIEQAEEELAR